MPPSRPSRTRPRRLLTLESSTEPLINEVRELATREDSFDVQFCDLSSLQERLAELVEEDADFVFLTIVDDVDKLKALVPLFKAHLKSLLQNGKIYALAVNRINHRDVPRILKRLGFSEVMSARTIGASRIKRKIDELFARFLSKRKDPSLDVAVPIREVGPIIHECRLQLVEPLTTPSDCWLLRRPQDIRVINEQWIIDLIGPGPSAGKWTRVDSAIARSSDGHSTWKWQPARTSEEFVKKNGLWVFEGKRPHFNEFHWTFTSRAPRLSYYENSEPVCDYFSLGKDKTLLIATNSEGAAQKWPAIQASVLNEYHYTAEAARIATPNWRITPEDDKHLPWRQLMGLDSPAAQPAVNTRHGLMREIQRAISPLDDLFSKVQDLDLRSSLIREMSERQCSAMVWTTGQRVRFGAKIRGMKGSLEGLIIEIPAGLSSAELLSALEVERSRLFVNVSLRRGSVFFAAEEVTLHDTTLELILPPILYQVQRRSYFRLAIPEEKGMFVRVGDQFHRVINISAGGLAFAADGVNRAVFTKGTELPRLSFQIYDYKIHCKGEVRWSKELPGTPTGSELTVGIRFQALRESDVQKLNLYVLEEGFEYFRQHVLSS